MPDPSHRPYQPMTIIRPNTKPRLWWLFPWNYAPTSGDFSGMIGKKRIASLFTAYDMVVEFRGAWKTEDQAKVVAWEAANNA